MAFFKREKEVIELAIKHLDAVENCLLTALNTIKAYLENDIKLSKRLAGDVEKTESKADLIRHSIRDKLYSGAYLPLLREDIYKLIESIDKVANAGEACCDFFLNQRPVFPENSVAQFAHISTESLGIVVPLKLSVLCFFKGDCSIEVVREHTKEVGFIESEVDRLEWDLTKVIFKSDLEHSRKMHLRQCIDCIVEVSDRAEDAADQLELASLKSMA